MLCYVRKKICLEKKYHERCRAFNRSSECFPQQLEATSVLLGEEPPIILVEMGHLPKGTTFHTADLKDEVRFTHLTLSEHAVMHVMPWRENAKSNKSTPPWTHHVSSCFWALKKFPFFG